MKEDAKPVRGIRISRMNAAIIAMSLLLYLFLSITAFHVSETVRDGYRAMEEFFTFSQIGEFFQNKSDYLTEQARLYVTTGETAHMENYFTEAHINRSREMAVEMLSFPGLGEEVTAPLDRAMERSNALMEQERYAMALASLAYGSEVQLLRPEMRSAPVTEEDRALSREELLAKAGEQIFSEEYQEVREQISMDIDDLFYALGDHYGQFIEVKYGDLRRAMAAHQGLIAIHFVATVVSFAFTLLLVSLPLGRSVKQVKEGKALRMSGAYECRRLIQAYNTMLDRVLANENALRHQAEHDALTGLLNRGAFEALQSSLKGCGRPLALLLVDVDKFKQINDGYGHEAGDRVLKKVAGLLRSQFRSTDYPVRVGGDEFAVIVMDAGAEEQETIAAKIEAINEILSRPDDGLPAASLSVGGAFSGAGFSESLYRDADAALYEVKEQGRRGCRFHAPALPCAAQNG